MKKGVRKGEKVKLELSDLGIACAVSGRRGEQNSQMAVAEEDRVGRTSLKEDSSSSSFYPPPPMLRGCGRLPIESELCEFQYALDSLTQT